MLYYRTLTTVLFATVVVIFFYALTPSLRWDRGALYVSHYVRRHLTALGAVLLLLLAWSYRLDIYESLLFGSGPGGAFSYSDHRTVIPVSIWLAYLDRGHGARRVLLRLDRPGARRVDDADRRAARARVLLRHVTPRLHAALRRPRAPTRSRERATRRRARSTRVARTRCSASERDSSYRGSPRARRGRGVAASPSGIRRRSCAPSDAATKAPPARAPIQWSTVAGRAARDVVEPPCRRRGGRRARRLVDDARLRVARGERRRRRARVRGRSAREPEQIGPRARCRFAHGTIASSRIRSA